MTSISNDANNTNNQDRRDPSGGNVEHGVPEAEAQCLLNGFNHQFLLKSFNVQRRSCESASP